VDVYWIKSCNRSGLVIVPVLWLDYGFFKKSCVTWKKNVTGFLASTHTKSNLRFYQNWTAGPVHFNSAHCISLEDNRSAFCCTFFLILWKPQVDDWRHSKATALLKLLLMNRDFTHSLPAVISLNLEWFEYREEPQWVITWSLDSIRLLPLFNTLKLSPSTTPITTTSDTITFSKRAAQNKAYFECQKLVHPHNDCWWIIGENFVYTALGTGKLPHNDYLKSLYLLKKLCVSKPGFVKCSHKLKMSYNSRF